MGLTARLALAAVLAVLLAADATPAASPVSAPGDVAGLVEIGDRSLYLECHGEGGPIVVLEAGWPNPGAVWDQAALGPGSGRTLVLPGVADFTRVCSYDRPGTIGLAGPSPDGPPFTTSRSDPVPQPQTAAAAVADLHALLGAAVPGPYVLVGHSYGGLVARLYAATYPVEVAGLVLVDALPAVEKFLTPAQWAGYQHLLGQQPAELAASPLRPLPLVVLTRVRPLELPPDLPPGFSGAALERAWAAGHAKLAALVPGAWHVVATESGHGIQQVQPELVIEAVRRVVEAVRDPATWDVTLVAAPRP